MSNKTVVATHTQLQLKYKHLKEKEKQMEMKHEKKPIASIGDKLSTSPNSSPIEKKRGPQSNEFAPSKKKSRM